MNLNLRTLLNYRALIIFTAFFSTFLFLVWTNSFGLRTALYLDTKIHSLNIQDGQVVQRSGQSYLNISGRVGLLADSIEVALLTPDKKWISENDWIDLDSSPNLTHFEGKIAYPSEGWIKIFSRSQGYGYRLANAIQVGIGEVFIIAGQSNASGGSETLFISQSNQVRTGQMQEDHSILWKQGDDPQIRGGGGSPWPLVGDLLVKTLDIPVGFINVAVGGSSIKEWEQGSQNFQGLIRAIEAYKPSGVRAILWHQGETDQGMTLEEYYTRLSKLIIDCQKVYKIPWMVAQATYADDNISESVRKAQKRIWDEGLAFEGPDTDVLGRTYRDQTQVHFNEAGTHLAAKLWFEKIQSVFFKK